MKLAKPRKRRKAKTRRLLGKYVVADPEICHGSLTFVGTRILVGDILEQLAAGMDFDTIVDRWGGRVPSEAIAEVIDLSRKALLAQR